MFTRIQNVFISIFLNFCLNVYCNSALKMAAGLYCKEISLRTTPYSQTLKTANQKTDIHWVINVSLTSCCEAVNSTSLLAVPVTQASVDTVDCSVLVVAGLDAIKI